MIEKYNLDQTPYDIPVVMILAGLCLAYCGFNVISKAYKFKRWSSVMGTVLSKKVIEPDPEQDRNTEKRRMVFRYGVEVRYCYTVDKILYKGNSLTQGLGEVFYTQAQAEKRIEKYVVGKPVEVFFNTLKPKKSVLERKLSILGYVASGLLFALGVLFFVLGAGGLLVLIE